MNYELIGDNSTASLLTQVFLNRGFTKHEMYQYLNPTDDYILSPDLLDNINEAADLIISNIQKKEKIVCIVDPDCDGFTSTAVLVNYCHKVFPDYKMNYVFHSGKQHGIELNIVPKDTKLLICADSASNDYEQHKQLKEQGIQVLVIDHHEAPKVSEYACVVNNQLCDYPNKSLSGVGVVYKVCQVLDSKLNVSYADNFLDLVALGEVADVMNLCPLETRRLIQKGIAQITNPFMATMVEKNAYSLGSEITPTGIAFYIAPYVNAVIRVGTQEEKKLLFESMLNFKGYTAIPSTKRGHKPGEVETIATQACRMCGNVKSHQTKERDHSVAVAEQLIKENNLLDKKILMICLPPESSCDKNLTGLIANVLMGKYQRPVLLLNKVVEDDGTTFWMGSGRGYDKSELTDFRGFLEDLGIFDRGGFATGHPNAFGFSIPEERISELTRITEEKLKDLDFSPTYKVDRIYNDITTDDYQDLYDICLLSSLWGQGIKEPRLAFEKVTPLNMTLMSPDKNPTLKIVLPNNLKCIKFKSSKEEYENLQVSKYGKLSLNIIGRCEKNEWNGNISPQIIIEDYEIVEKQKFYF